MSTRHPALPQMNRKQKDTMLSSAVRSACDNYFTCYGNQNAPEVDRKSGQVMTYNGTYNTAQTLTPLRGIKSRYVGTSSGPVYNWLSIASPFGRITQDITFTMWVNMRSKSAEMGIMSRYQATQEEYILSFDVTNNKFRWYIYSAAMGNQFAYSDNFVNPLVNTWYFITCGVRNFNSGKQMFISVNDRPYNVTTMAAGAFSYGTADFRLGRFGSSGVTGVFEGNISHFSKYNRALSEQEKNLIYSRGMVNPYPFNT